MRAAVLFLLALPIGCNSIAGLDALTLDRAPSGAGGSGGSSGGSGGAQGGSGGDDVGGGGQGGAGGGTLPAGVLCATALPVDMGDAEWMRAAAWDHDDGVVVVGQVRGTFETLGIETEPDDTQAFVARFDANCEPTYVKLWGGAQVDIAEGVAIDLQGNAVVTGQYRGDAVFDTNTLPSGSGAELFVAKIAPDGQLLWVRGFAGNDVDRGKSVAVGSDGSIVVTGTFKGTLTMGGTTLTAVVVDPPLPNPSDPFVAKLDSSGNVKWATSFGGPGWQHIDDVAIDPSGVIAVGGALENSLTIGATTLVAKEQSDAYLALLDAGGTPVWARSIGAEPFVDDWDYAAESMRSVEFAPDGKIVGLLRFSGSLDLGAAGMLASGPLKANARVAFQQATGEALTAMMLPSPDSERLRVSGIASPSTMVSARFVVDPFEALGPYAPFIGGRQLAIARHGASAEIVDEVQFPLANFSGPAHRWIGADRQLRIPAALENGAGDIFVMLTNAPYVGFTDPFLKGRNGAFMARVRP